MYAGHYALAFPLKRAFPETPLWALFAGVQAVDIAFLGLVLAGVERVSLDPHAFGPLVLQLEWMPYTHSLLMAGVYAAAIAAAGWALDKPRIGLALALATASHWFADVVVHTPDMHLGLAEGGARIGLALWTWPVLAWALEVAMVVGFVALWLAAEPDPGVRRRLKGLAGALIVAQTGFALSPGMELAPWIFPTVGLIGMVGWTVAAWWCERPPAQAPAG